MSTTNLIFVTHKSRVQKAVQSLLGIIEGMSCDSIISEDEKRFLFDWLEINRQLLKRHPFNDLLLRINVALEDNVLTSEEKNDIIWLCEKYSEKSTVYVGLKSEIQKLHGFLTGIISDGFVSDQEILGLRDWLNDHEELKTTWPYDELQALIIGILIDKKVSPEERKILESFFYEFSVIDDKTTITNPLLLEGNSIRGICAVDPSINFDGKRFCFTGESSRFSRKEIVKIIIENGGKYSETVSGLLDYLIIGSNGNPAWAYSCYGRKVEQVVKLRKEGKPIVIVHEVDFHDALVK